MINLAGIQFLARAAQLWQVLLIKAQINEHNQRL